MDGSISRESDHDSRRHDLVRVIRLEALRLRSMKQPVNVDAP